MNNEKRETREKIEGFDSELVHHILRSIRFDLQEGRDVVVKLTTNDPSGDLEDDDDLEFEAEIIVNMSDDPDDEDYDADDINDDPCDGCEESCCEECCPDSAEEDSEEDSEEDMARMTFTPAMAYLIRDLLELYYKVVKFTSPRNLVELYDAVATFARNRGRHQRKYGKE